MGITANRAMATAVATETALPRPQMERLPWVVWTSALAVASVATGSLWDISWHISVGRDTFWTPPHLLIQLCAAIGGLTSVYLIARATFGNDRELRAASVGVFGLRAPLGAFLCGWGALAMLTSAPFDNWWHEAYGLDVKVLSPPHTVLAMGAAGIIVGGILLTMAQRNRATPELARRIETVFLVTVGFLMIGVQSDLIELSNRALMHSAIFYRALAVPFPVDLLVVRRVSERRWACTLVASVYTALSLTQEWVLPLFPAAQKLSPVYQHVPYMVPLGFPFLVIVPAVVFDLAWPRIQAWPGWRQALTLGPLFLVALLTAQWPFANFLMSPASANWIFGTHYRMYFVPPESPAVVPQFFPWEKTALEFWQGMAIALATAILTSRLALRLGAWFRTVQR